MDIKTRSIQMDSHDSRFIIDEYGLEDGTIYHRYIVITRDIFETFQKDPDDNLRLEAFLQRHKIDPGWQKVTEAGLHEHTGLQQAVRAETPTADSKQAGETADPISYEQVREALTEKDALINNPLMLDVFNEGIRAHNNLNQWETVFPFFRS